MNQMYEVDMNMDYMPYAQDNQNQMQQLRQMQETQQAPIKPMVPASMQQPTLLQRVERDASDVAQDIGRGARRVGGTIERETRRGVDNLGSFIRRNANLIILLVLVIVGYLLYTCGVFDGLVQSTENMFESRPQLTQLPSSGQEIPIATLEIPQEVQSLFR